MIKRARWLFTALISVFFFLAVSGGVFSQTIPFETIDKGEISYFRYEDPLFQGAQLVIRDMNSWHSFWKLHTQTIDPPPPVPKLNFSKEMAIAVVLGNQGSGGGPSIEITSIDPWPGDVPASSTRAIAKGKGMKVTVRESRAPGPLAIVTNPYHVVKVKSGLSVLFEHSSLGNTCSDNSQCEKENFCDKAEGNCDGTGTCQLRPDVCPLYFAYAPVCGCDGKTYDSECAAAMAGISVLHKGRCESLPCQATANCVIGEFCLFVEGTCAPPGSCNPRPEVCPQIYAPVCGCDGVSYGNACEAYGAGASILHPGACS